MSKDKNGWIDTKKDQPDLIKGENYSENVYAWWMGSLHIMCYCYIPGSGGGFAWANCGGNINGDAEFDDNYYPTHWQPLPSAPVNSALKTIYDNEFMTPAMKQAAEKLQRNSVKVVGDKILNASDLEAMNRAEVKASGYTHCTVTDDYGNDYIATAVYSDQFGLWNIDQVFYHDHWIDHAAFSDICENEGIEYSAKDYCKLETKKA